MRHTFSTLNVARIVSLLLCILISNRLWAQDSNKPNNENPQQMALATSSPSADKGANSMSAPLGSRPHDNSFVIGADDVLAINVWKEPEISRSVPVRSDGRISLPLVGELQASGQTPRQLEQEISAKLKSYISEPEVTVIVQEIKSQKFNILGQVMRPGSYPLTNSPTVLDAIALAGGFRDFAKRKGIYVLRQKTEGGELRLPFNYNDVIKGKNSVQNIALQPRDTVVVP